MTPCAPTAASGRWAHDAHAVMSASVGVPAWRMIATSSRLRMSSTVDRERDGAAAGGLRAAQQAERYRPVVGRIELVPHRLLRRPT
jgi:hypothetical protein